MAPPSYRDRRRPDPTAVAQVDVKRRILVVCEGTVTEPAYFNGLVRWQRNPRVKVVSLGLGFDPKSLVAEAHRRVGGGKPKSADPDDAPFDEAWAVFDRDQHTTFDAAIALAERLGVRVATSAPCFELWLYLHFFEAPGGTAECKELGAKLSKPAALPGYDKAPDFAKLAPRVPAACKRARHLRSQKHRDGEPTRSSPHTDIDLLVDELTK
jgi:hypothetical protein